MPDEREDDHAIRKPGDAVDEARFSETMARGSRPTMRLAVVPGDGIGPEVMRVTVPLLDAALRLDGMSLDVEELDWGGDHWHRTGAMVPPDAAGYIAGFDAVLFGAVGRLDIPPTSLYGDLSWPCGKRLICTPTYDRCGTGRTFPSRYKTRTESTSW